MSPGAIKAAHALVGRPGSRWRLPTPALVVDLDALEANVAKMAARADAAGVSLWPHAKTHKSAYVAQLQIAAGATGISCAKLGEAEALADAGVEDFFVTSPVASRDVAERAVELTRSVGSLYLTVDHPVGVATLDAASASSDIEVAVLIDVDVGMGRTGVATPREALDLAAQIRAAPNLHLYGVQGYGGAWQHVVGRRARRDAVRAGMAHLKAVVEALREAGHKLNYVTGGGTGSFAADVELEVLNALQPGSYVYMDAQYADALGRDADGAFATALTVQAQVVSTNAPGWVTVDAGLKAFATDAGAPRPTPGRFGGVDYAFFGDEHGRLARPNDGPPVAHGDRVEFVTPHCDPTVDRYDVIHLVRGDTLVDIRPIDAARCAQ